TSSENEAAGQEAHIIGEHGHDALEREAPCPLAAEVRRRIRYPRAVPSASSSTLDRIRRALGQVLHGKPDVIDLVLVGVLGGGHVLVEDVPGVGKTTLAKALARAFRAAFTRVQF